MKKGELRKTRKGNSSPFFILNSPFRLIRWEPSMHLQFSTACLPRFPLRSSFATARALGLESVQIALPPRLYRRGPERLAREAERHGVVVRSLALGMLGGASLVSETVAGIAAF